MGLVAALLSAVFSSAKDLLSKRLAFQLDGTVSTFASFGFALPFYVLVLAVLYLLGRETGEWSLLFLMLVLLRSSTDTVAEWLKMHAFAHGDISVVATFFSLSPLFLLLTSPLITRDPLALPDVVAVVLVVGGSLLMVYRPSKTGWADQKKGVSEVARVLAPNGRWLLADFVGRGIVRSLTQLFRLHRFFDRKGLDEFIAEAGLAVVTERPSGWLGRSVPVLAIKKVERAMGIEPT